MGIIHLDDRGELLSVIVMNHFLQQLFPACVQPPWLVLPDLTGHTVVRINCVLHGTIFIFHADINQANVNLFFFLLASPLSENRPPQQQFR